MLQILQIKRLDKVRNETVYELVNEVPLINTVKGRQLSHIGHALRLKRLNDRAKIFALYELADNHGVTKLGRHRTTYKEQIASYVFDNRDIKPKDKQIEDLALNKII
jgi:hypothetical protein